MKKITCSSCGGWSKVDIDEVKQQILWREIGTVISGRMRFDNQWGWQCTCGNNNLMTKQEKQTIKDYTQPTPQEIDDIKNNLVIKPATEFAMEG